MMRLDQVSVYCSFEMEGSGSVDELNVGEGDGRMSLMCVLEASSEVD